MKLDKKMDELIKLLACQWKGKKAWGGVEPPGQICQYGKTSV